jgi:hypothetical protein
MSRFIGIKGLAGHGKDTVANIITDYLSPTIATKVSFADPLKEILSIVSGIPKDKIDQSKTDTVPEFGMTVRTMLQKIGTDAMRNQVDDEVWIKIAERRIKDIPRHKIVIFPDVRFENEMNFIKRNKGVLLNVYRPHRMFDDSVYQHISEQGNFEVDYTIINDGSLEDLRRKVYSIMGEVFLTYSSI